MKVVGLKSSFKIAAGIFEMLANAIEDAGGIEADLRRIETDSGLRRKLADLIVGGAKDAAANIFKVTVDYGKSLQDMIAEGKYDYVNSDITEKYFPINPPAGGGKSEVEVELVHYNKAMTSDRVLADFKERGLKPAPIEVGLALGREKPNLQRQFPIVILGSVWRGWRGPRVVPALWSRSGGRRLHLPYFGRGWSEGDRFLGVCEV